ncbi:hypothetical protein VP1G_10180 [Cytospora mali]|uniref:Uncharacterized protein n=1 Tax=Cytospora mali TaxID=578113 RepID=A0A194VGB6_CYTMA|nr:hypothetical protein VP1G_10180 [Valsa mali var. pyri (nom. inval.)]
MSLRILQAMCLLTMRTALAAVSLQDPSDVIPASAWAADNALIADYNIPLPKSQPSDVLAKHVFKGNQTSVKYAVYTVDANDTSVILVSDSATVDLSYVNVIKFGYSTNLDDASFWGFNAAINVANASTASFNHINVTAHNGAANIYSYGTDTVVNVTNSWLYSSGPVSHGLYAAGNGTIYGSKVQHFSGGRRSSSFAGDSPKGTVYVSDSVAHTTGIGSATFYALGQIFANNVAAIAENAPTVFMDGTQNISITNCECTAGLLGGLIIFSSAVREAGASVDIRDSKLTTTGSTMPGLWFGNVISDVYLYNTQVATASGVLVVANFSQVTQDFDHYASYSDNSDLAPAEAYITVAESYLAGDLVAYNNSYISWNLTSHSYWAGASYSGYGQAQVDVSLDATSNWTLTATSYVQNITDADSSLANIASGGHTLYYNPSALLNGWLNNKTIALSGGGSITPGTQS